MNKLFEFVQRIISRDSRLESRFVRFLLVGASGLVINNLCLILITESVGIHYLISTVMATQCSTLWNYILTEVWVFSKQGERRPLGRLARFFLMNNAALLFRGPLITLLVIRLGLHYVPANLISIFFLAVLRYVLSEKWIWTPSLKENGTFTYDIHNIIGIESTIHLPELEYFRVAELDRDPDIRLRQEDHKNHRPLANSIYYNDGLGRFGFELLIERENRVEIKVSQLVKKSPHVLYTNIFEPVLRWIFVEKGYALVHAASLILEDQGVLITAQTDTGKTSTILQILKNHPGAFISDDMTILSKDGRVFNYPKPLTISSHTLKALDTTSLDFRERLMLLFQSRIHSRSGRKFALWLARTGLPVASINALVQILIPPPKYMVGRLIPGVQVADSANLSQIIQIERGPDFQEECDLNDMTNYLHKNAEDAYGFPPYENIAGSLKTWQNVDLQLLERQTVQMGVKGCRAWRLVHSSYGWWRQLPEIIKYNSNGAHPD